MLVKVSSINIVSDTQVSVAFQAAPVEGDQGVVFQSLNFSLVLSNEDAQAYHGNDVFELSLTKVEPVTEAKVAAK